MLNCIHAHLSHIANYRPSDSPKVLFLNHQIINPFDTQVYATISPCTVNYRYILAIMTHMYVQQLASVLYTGVSENQLHS